MQWGRPVGQHAAIAHKISFIAATSFAQEAVLDLSAHLADAGRHDIRIEAALAKLWSSEMSWLVADELVQIRGGRGYETAESLRARGERAVPAEQILRDLRINRIFEGSTEIMHLLIAREAVDAHLQAAGDIIDPDVDLSGKAKAAAKASRLLRSVVAASGRGHAVSCQSSYAEFGAWPGTCATSSAHRAGSPARPSTEWPAGRAGWSVGRVSSARIVDIGAELFAMAASCVRAQMQRSAATPAPLSSPTCSAGSPGCASSGCSTRCGITPTPSTSGWRRRFWTADTPGSRPT